MVKLLWVALVATSAFVLGYTLKPAPSMRRVSPFALMRQMRSRPAPPLNRYYRR